jgi:hypothetical protein
MDEFYKGYYIHTVLDLSLKTDCWVPKAEVVWEEWGVQRRRQLVGLDDVFKSLDDAEIYAVETARGWVDGQLAHPAPISTEPGLREQSRRDDSLRSGKLSRVSKRSAAKL